MSNNKFSFKENISKNVLLSALIVLVITFLGLNYFFNLSGYFKKSEIVEEGDSLGKISLTLSKVGSLDVGLYNYNLSRNKLEEYYVPGDTVIISGDTDNNNNFITSSNFNTGDPNIFQLWLINADRNTRQITDSETYLKREPKWSPDKTKIIFNAMESMDGEQLVPGDWGIYITDLNGNEELLTNGAHPLFASDGKHIVFLKNDGLYLFNLDSKMEEKIWNLRTEGGQAHVNMQFDISWEEEMLAWSAPEIGEIYLIKIHSWEPFSGEIVKLIKETHCFWPVFSPDGKYLAVNEVDWNGKDSPTNLRLTYFDLESLEKKLLLSLEKFEPSLVWINDWNF